MTDPTGHKEEWKKYADKAEFFRKQANKFDEIATTFDSLIIDLSSSRLDYYCTSLFKRISILRKFTFCTVVFLGVGHNFNYGYMGDIVGFSNWVIMFGSEYAHGGPVNNNERNDQR